MKRPCELCIRAARIYCKADQASLCWLCDAEVHSANFLVAQHSRSLLCRVCQSPTPWFAVGSKLQPTFSDCNSCVKKTGCRDGEEAVEEEQELVENQITPWSPPPPPASDSSLSGEEAVSMRKRDKLWSDCYKNENIRMYAQPSDTVVAEAASSAATKSREIAARSLHHKQSVFDDEMSHGSVAVDLNLSLSLTSR